MIRKYKLLKDLPTNKAGTIFTTTDNYEYTPVGDAYPKLSLFSINNLEWFEEICEWPKSWEDIENFNTGYYIDTDSEIAKITRNIFRDFDKNVVPTKAHAKSILAFAQLSMLAKAMNGDDWKPRLGVKKFVVVYHQLQKLHTTYTENISELISFKTREMAEFSLKHHKELWEDYWMINK